MKYEPYNFDSFKELVRKAYGAGNFSGTRTHFELVCEGTFEGWHGRATEDWEVRFRLELPDGNEFVGDTVKEACDKALAFLGEIAKETN